MTEHDQDRGGGQADERSKQFLDDIAHVINKYSRENGSNTPDFLLAEFLVRCLNAFDKASWAREKWYGQHLSIGSTAASRVTPEPAALRDDQIERFFEHEPVTYDDMLVGCECEQLRVHRMIDSDPWEKWREHVRAALAAGKP